MDIHESENAGQVCADLTLKGFTALGTKKRSSVLPFLIVGLTAFGLGVGIMAVLKRTPVPAPEFPPEPSSKIEMTIEVSAQKMWTDTECQVREGDVIEISASGEVTACSDKTDAAYKWVDANGRGMAPQFRRASTGEQTKFILVLGENNPLMCLTGKIGRDGTPFKVGRSWKRPALRSGTLYLGVNDNISDSTGRRLMNTDQMGITWTDNDGAFTVTVKRNAD